MVSAFEGWELGITPITPRSRFYSLAPIGIGTAFAESLTGYVARLAEAHAVSVGSLVGKELSRLVRMKPGAVNLGLVAYAINGVGDSAKRWVQGLETMTQRSDLRYLTLLPFERLFPKPLLFRRVRAWCPTCCELRTSRGEPIYDPLLWCLRLVEVCPRHRRFLVTTCPHCRRSLRPLAAGSRPGFCSRCGLWLGDATKGPEAAAASDAVPTPYQLWLADAIGQLLACAPQIQPERLRDRARCALLAYADAFAEGNRTAVSELAGFRRRGALDSWFRGRQMPRIDTLLRTWYQLQLPVACLLDDASPALSLMQAIRSPEVRNKREVAPKRRGEQIRAALEAALDGQPAPSLIEVARRLGYSTTNRLHDTCGDLCRQIVLNYRRSGRSHWWRRRGAKPICELSRLRKVLEDYLAAETPIPPLDLIAARLGYASDQSLRQKLPELTRALAARIAEQKAAQVKAIEPALQQALRETPPPSLRQIAKRLGFSAGCVLKAHAPALFERFKMYRQSYAKMCRRELRDKLEAALVENPPPDLRSVYSRLGVTESIVNTSFPELRHAIGLRCRQYRQQQARARRDAVQAEIREIVRMLHAQGICPSVPRVTSLLQRGSLREWRAVHAAVTDARCELARDANTTLAPVKRAQKFSEQ